MTKLHQFFKNWNQIETRKNLRTNLIFLDENSDKKIN